MKKTQPLPEQLVPLRIFCFFFLFLVSDIVFLFVLFLQNKTAGRKKPFTSLQIPTPPSSPPNNGTSTPSSTEQQQDTSQLPTPK